ncbi:hypothetical protein NKR23_g10263 [Pleurostoma richardsiae]|uniref:Xylanolytic transcriptional activator regulatory domain-containing protein n=1 Tax=Pleurostoma richardsiae TaxID=41990 RepID=A0AA38VLX5_9PEZI|nr:hypothetical protein NKR23_g10263 [Pleurostoma richardsiae]
MSRFLRSYFSFFHRHTPLLHLPFWNISTTSTRLIFSVVLMGAMYSGDLDSKSSTDRQLCQLAQTFAWTTDPGLQANGSAQLDTVQAAYIATLLEAFYFPAKRHRPPVDTTRLVNEARNAGVFKPIHGGSWKMKWDEWSIQECRTRTAFILYLFDAIQAIFFDRRPQLHLHELHLPLPCDENIFAAGSEGEWRELCQNAQELTRLEYPVVLSLFLCHRPVEIPLYFSVMGAFVILHGILLHIWEQTTIHVRRHLLYVPDVPEQNVRDHLARVQSQVADNALQLWRTHWDRTVSRPAFTDSEGLYRDRALVYWFLGNVMNSHGSLAGIEAPCVSVDGKWTLRIPRLLRRLTVLADSGQLDGMGDDTTAGTGEKLASCLEDLQGNADSNAVGEDIDKVILSCMMRKR